MQYVLFLIKTNLRTQRDVLKEQKSLNIYQLNILSKIIFIHRVEKGAPSIFLTKFCKPSHPYPTNFVAHNFFVPILKLKKCRYRVSIRGPLLWNNILTAAEKTQECLPKFRTTMKEKLLSMTNEINYFWTGNIKAKHQFLSDLNYSNSIILHSR